MSKEAGREVGSEQEDQQAVCGGISHMSGISAGQDLGRRMDQTAQENVVLHVSI